MAVRVRHQPRRVMAPCTCREMKGVPLPGCIGRCASASLEREVLSDWDAPLWILRLVAAGQTPWSELGCCRAGMLPFDAPVASPPRHLLESSVADMALTPAVEPPVAASLPWQARLGFDTLLSRQRPCSPLGPGEAFAERIALGRGLVLLLPAGLPLGQASPERPASRLPPGAQAAQCARSSRSTAHWPSCKQRSMSLFHSGA